MCCFCNKNQYNSYAKSSSSLNYFENEKFGGCYQNGWGEETHISHSRKPCPHSCPYARENCNKRNEECFKVKFEGIIKFC